MTLLFIGGTELVLIAVVALLLFGGKKLPELMRGLGQGVREFKNGMNEMTSDAPVQNAKPASEPQPEQPKEENKNA